MKKWFLYIGLALFIGAFIGCQGKEGKQGPAGTAGTAGTNGATGETGTTGAKGERGETGATPEIWLYSELLTGEDTDGAEELWEFTLSSAVPFTTDSSRVMVSLGGSAHVYSDRQDRHLMSVTTHIIGWEVIGGTVIKVYGYTDFGDWSWDDAYEYEVILNVIAFDQNYKVKGERKVTMPLKKFPAPMDMEKKQ